MIDKAKISQSNNFIKRQCLCCRVAKYSKYKSAIPSYDINRYRYYGSLKDGRDVYLYVHSSGERHVYLTTGSNNIGNYFKTDINTLGKVLWNKDEAEDIKKAFNILYTERCPCKC